jgi:expansin (peptidoglycan-binding protein)
MTTFSFLRLSSGRVVLGYFCVVLTALACGIGGGSDQNATVEALSQSIAQTATAAGVEEAEIVLNPEETVAAIQAAATAQVQVQEATQVAVATTDTGDQSATDEALAPIRAELPTYGIDPSQGMLGWIQPPLTVQTEGYLQYDYGGDFLSTVARDFVLAADVTWNTRFGSTACGYVIRSDGNEEAFNQYLVLATRGAQGHVGFAIMQDGEVKDDEITDIYANGIDPRFEWQNDTTNRLTVVGKGNTFTIYTNGTKIGEVTPSVAYDRGFTAFTALNESGDTTCQFDNGWLWLLN